MKYIIAIIIISIVLIILIYNTMLSKRNKLKNSYSSLDVVLKRRYDLIPNIVETVKAYSKYEKSTLENIINIRKSADECKSSKDLENVSNNYNSFISDVIAISEKYPELKAGENYLNLQKVLFDVEEQISAARRTYNAHVQNYNTYISFFPLNIFASIFGFKKYDFFEINENEKEMKL